MNETNKTLIICFVGVLLLINITMITDAFTRRSADDKTKIINAEWSVLREKLDRQAKECTDSGGRVDYWDDGVHIDCKKK